MLIAKFIIVTLLIGWIGARICQNGHEITPRTKYEFVVDMIFVPIFFWLFAIIFILLVFLFTGKPEVFCTLLGISFVLTAIWACWIKISAVFSKIIGFLMRNN